MNLSAKILTSTEFPSDAVDLQCHPELYGECVVDTKKDALYLRERPTTDSGIILAMEKGSSFFSYGLTDDAFKWVLGQTETPSGKLIAGFAYIEYLKLKKEDNKK